MTSNAKSSHLLMALQDLDQMIHEAEDESRRGELEKLGFPVTGLENLHEAQEALEAQLPPQLLSRYRRLAERSGRAVVPVVNASCTGCFSAIPHSFISSVHADQIMNCETCGRILYWP